MRSDRNIYMKRKNRVNVLKIIVFSACLTFLQACFHKERTYLPLLLEADSLIADNPQKAIEFLKSIEPRIDKKGKNNQMHHALLSIKAKDKADLPLTDIDGIEKIVAYYENVGDERLLPLAYYYAGRTFAENKDALTALDYFHKAEDILTKTNDDIKLLATIYSQEGYLLNLRRMFIDARECFQKAYECDKSIQDTVGMVYDLQDIGTSYTWNKEEKECLQSLKEALYLAKKTGKQNLILGIERSLAFNYKDLNMYDSAWVYTRRLMHANDSLSYDIVRDLFFKAGQLDSAAYYCRKSLEQGNLYRNNQSHRMLTEIALQQNDSKLALKHFLAYQTLEDSIDEMNGTEAIALAKSLYDYQQHEMKNQMLETKNRNNRIIIGFVLMGAVVLFFIIIALWQYNKRKRLELEDRYLRLKLLHEDNIRKRELHQEKLNAINRKVEDTDTYKAFVKMLKNDKNPQKKDWLDLENTLNHYYENCMQKIQTLYKMTDRELHVSMLTKINFKPSDIASLLNININSVASVRSRLYKKCFGKEGKAKDWDDFICNL